MTGIALSERRTPEGWIAEELSQAVGKIAECGARLRRDHTIQANLHAAVDWLLVSISELKNEHLIGRA